jgi:hypothetical protein
MSSGSMVSSGSPAGSGTGDDGGPGASGSPGDDAGGSGSPAGSGGTSSGAGGGGGPNPYQCTLFMGTGPLHEWFCGGFLKHAGIDRTKFEAFLNPHHYLAAYATALPNPVYNLPATSSMCTDMPMNNSLNNPQLDNACATNPMMPDRVIYQPSQWGGTPLAAWTSGFAGVVKNIQAKWPSVKRIEIMLSPSGPGAMPMYPNGIVPNGMGDTPCPGGTEQSYDPMGQAALDALPAMFKGVVFATPGAGKHFQVLNCGDFNPGAAQYSAMGAADLAKVYGDFFASQTF